MAILAVPSTWPHMEPEASRINMRFPEAGFDDIAFAVTGAAVAGAGAVLPVGAAASCSTLKRICPFSPDRERAQGAFSDGISQICVWPFFRAILAEASLFFALSVTVMLAFEIEPPGSAPMAVMMMWRSGSKERPRAEVLLISSVSVLGLFEPAVDLGFTVVFAEVPTLVYPGGILKSAASTDFSRMFLSSITGLAFNPWVISLTIKLSFCANQTLDATVDLPGSRDSMTWQVYP